MEKELSIVTYIKAHGLQAAEKEFKLLVRDYGHKVLLKYSQIDSDMSLPEVQDARGLILEKGTWKVMSLPFRKFFNAAEGHAAKIDWETALILEKLDGSLMQLYYDWVLDEWCVGTSGTADASGEVNNKMGTTFADLFWGTIAKLNGKFHMITSTNAHNKFTPEERTARLNEFLNKDFCWIFELTTPYNVVVKPHTESSVTLLTARNVNTLEELSYENLCWMRVELDVPVVKAFDINASNVGHILATLEGMPWSEEGYVVVDEKFNRIKIKNPAYVAVHHLKSKTAEYNILEIVKSNEIDEFGATFPERLEEITQLHKNYHDLRIKLNEVWVVLQNHKPKNITKEETKKYAMKVFEITKEMGVPNHTGLYFGLKDGKVESVDKYLFEFDNKKLYEIL